MKRIDKEKQRIYDYARKVKKRFSKRAPDSEPIDFSSPSIPYYSELAERFSAARMLIYIVLFVFLLVTIIFGSEMITYSNLYYLVKDINAAAVDGRDAVDYLSYPTSGGEQSYALYRDGLVVVGGDEITVLSASGKQTLTDNVAYSAPCVRSADRYFLAFGLGEKSFAVYNSFVRIFAEVLEYPVYEAAVSDSGAFAVVTRSREYRSEVNVYDADMQKITSYRTAGYVTAVSLNSGGDRMVISTVDSEGETSGARLIFFKPGADEPEAEITLGNEMIYRCRFMGNSRIAVISDRGVAVYDFDGEIVESTDYSSDTPLLFDLADSNIGLLESGEESGLYYVKVFDRNGKELYNKEISSDTPPKQLRLAGTDAYILTESGVHRVTRRGENTILSLPDDEVECLLARRSGNILACTMTYATGLHESD